MTKTSRQGGALYLILMACALASAPMTTKAGEGTLPAGWTAHDVGNPVLTGAESSDGGTFTLTGAGADIWNNSDQFRFIHQPVQGDVEVIARVASLQYVHEWSKAGVMIRESLSAGSRHAFMFGSGTEGWNFQRRVFTSSSSDHTWGGRGSAPGWVRLVRQGSLFSAYESADGSAWNLVGSATISMSQDAFVGLALTSHDENARASATFTNVSVRVVSSPPSSWTGLDVGNPAIAGAESVAGGTFTITGAGVDIWDDWDQFRFLYQPVEGNVEIIARLESLQQIDVWSKAGVMIRESLNGSSKHVFMFGSGANGWDFQRRVSTWGSSDHSWGPQGRAPGWIRLVREGSLFSAYESSDGSTWTLVGTEPISMSQSAFAGLAVTSHNPGAPATATFSNVLVRAHNPGTNQSPTVSLTSPSANATYAAPATMTLAATAADTDGSISRVDFYAGSQLVASDTSAPFSRQWSNVPVGTYALRAVATDNEGATASSASINVTVNPASNLSPSVSITSPTAGTSFTAGSTVTITANASDTDGSVSSVDFYAGSSLIGSDSSSPYSVAWVNVPAGSYVLTGVARDNVGGSRTSAGVSISVAGAQPRPTTLVFVASSDHNTSVTSYVVAIYRSSDPVTANPAATRDLGQPSVVNGEISVNISTTIDPLPTGSYYAVVSAIGSGGTAASAPSATFTK